MSLHAHQLRQTRGERTLFTGLDLALDAGQALWVQGPNGSGKSSLLRVLCGLAEPDAGEVHWQGLPLHRLGASYFDDVLYLGHANGVKDDLLAWENVVITATLAGQACRRDDAFDALQALGLDWQQAQLPARALSQGQRKRVALARLCLPRPRALWVLDEPFSALDDATIATLHLRLQAHLSEGGLVVYTTHQPLALQARGLQTLTLNPHDATTAPCWLH
jgi:heme exporter protein A